MVANDVSHKACAMVHVGCQNLIHRRNQSVLWKRMVVETSKNKVGIGIRYDLFVSMTFRSMSSSNNIPMILTYGLAFRATFCCGMYEQRCFQRCLIPVHVVLGQRNSLSCVLGFVGKLRFWYSALLWCWWRCKCNTVVSFSVALVKVPETDRIWFMLGPSL